jgi:hypothetical protein
LPWFEHEHGLYSPHVVHLVLADHGGVDSGLDFPSGTRSLDMSILLQGVSDHGTDRLPTVPSYLLF